MWLLLYLSFEFTCAYHDVDEESKSEEMVKVIGGVGGGEGGVEVLVELEEEGACVLVRAGYHDHERDELCVDQLYPSGTTRDQVGADDEKDEDHFYFLVELLESLAPVGLAADRITHS